jgi:hypothetical protein
MGLTAAKSRTRNPFAEDYLQWSLWRGDKLLFAGQIDEAVAWLDARKREAAAARTI